MTNDLTLSTKDLIFVAATLAIVSRQTVGDRRDFDRLCMVFMSAASDQGKVEILQGRFHGTPQFKGTPVPAAMEAAT